MKLTAMSTKSAVRRSKPSAAQNDTALTGIQNAGCVVKTSPALATITAAAIKPSSPSWERIRRNRFAPNRSMYAVNIKQPRT